MFLGVLSLVAGVAAHLAVFIRGEWHLHGLQILAFHATAIATLCCYAAWQEVLLYSSSYVAALFGSIVVYRLYFHRLRDFPGPKSLAVSKLSDVLYTLDSKGHIHMNDLYEKYGPIVRTGPSELSIFVDNAFDVMFREPGTSNSAWHDITGLKSCIFSRSKTDTGRYRGVFEKGLRNLMYSPDLFPPHVRELLDTIDQVEGSPSPVTKILESYSFRFMKKMVYGMDSETYEKEREDYLKDRQNLALTLLGPFPPVPWLIIMILRLKPVLERLPMIRDTPLGCWWSFEEEAADLVQPEVLAQRTGKDEHRYSLAVEFAQQYLASPTDKDADDSLLNGNSLTAMVGANDTMSATLKILLYHLSTHKSYVKQIYEEVKDIDWQDREHLKTLPYLNGFISESMRTIPVASTFAFRQTPSEGCFIKSQKLPGGSVFVPGDVTLRTSRYTLSKLETAWDRPDEFLPERWFTPGMVRCDATKPFASGPRLCPGKDLALAHLRQIVAALVQRYSIDTAPEDAAKVCDPHQWRSYLTLQVPAYMVTFHRR